MSGFLSELLKFDVTIETILESEGNKQHEYDKYNRVDILLRTAQNELILVEIQNDPENDYFQRMIYGVSKLITEYIKEGEPYGSIKKVFSINIVYFGLGQGEDYVYEYKGEFVGLHLGKVLRLTPSQQKNYKIGMIADIFPKYYILKINNFDDVAKDTLDEWIYFLKNSEIKDEFKAKGLAEAREKLRYEKLSDLEKQTYNRYQENRRIERSVTDTAISNSLKKVAKSAILKKFDNQTIADITGLDADFIEMLRTQQKTMKININIHTSINSCLFSSN